MTEWKPRTPPASPENRSVFDGVGDAPLPPSPPLAADPAATTSSTPLASSAWPAPAASPPTTPRPSSGMSSLPVPPLPPSPPEADTAIFPVIVPTAKPFQPVVTSPPLASPPAADPDPAPPKRRRRVGAIVAAGTAVALLAGVGGYVGTELAEDDFPVVAGQAPATVDRPTIDPPTQQPVDPVPAIIADDPVGNSGLSAEPVAAAAAAVAPAVVRIDTGGGTGSGVLYDESGLLITNAHVVGNFDEVTVRLADGRRTDGTVLGRDPNVDIAVVQIDPDLDFDVAVFAPTSTVEVGQLAVAIGSPFGLEQSVTAGIISAVNRAIPSQTPDGVATVVEMVQTDAPINPGNSGGALADRQGRVVGINTSIRTDGTTQGNLGVGFAVPSDTALLIAGRIVAGESLDSGFLGVSGQDPTAGDPGALVTDVVEGGPAESGGLQDGDLIIAIDGTVIPGMTELAARIRLSAPGTTVSLDVLRDGLPVTVEVTLGMAGAN